MGTVPKRGLGGGPNTHKGGTPGRDRLGSLSVVSPYGTGVPSVTAWPLLSQVSLSLHGPRCHRCHCHCMVPGVWHSVTVTARTPGHHTVSPWLHSPTRVTRCCRAALLYCGASLLLPGVSHGVTVTAQCTGCHCHCGAAGCHALSLQLPWVVAQSHRQCLVHGVSRSAMSLHGPWGVTPCHRHCMAWGVTHHHCAGCSPVPPPCTSRGLSPSVTAHPPQLCHSPSPPAVGHPGDSTAGPSSPSPWGDTTLSPSPPPPPRLDPAASRAAISHRSPAGPINRALIK